MSVVLTRLWIKHILSYLLSRLTCFILMHLSQHYHVSLKLRPEDDIHNNVRMLFVWNILYSSIQAAMRSPSSFPDSTIFYYRNICCIIDPCTLRRALAGVITLQRAFTVAIFAALLVDPAIPVWAAFLPTVTAEPRLKKVNKWIKRQDPC